MSYFSYDISQTKYSSTSHAGDERSYGSQGYPSQNNNQPSPVYDRPQYPAPKIYPPTYPSQPCPPQSYSSESYPLQSYPPPSYSSQVYPLSQNTPIPIRSLVIST